MELKPLCQLGGRGLEEKAIGVKTPPLGWAGHLRQSQDGFRPGRRRHAGRATAVAAGNVREIPGDPLSHFGREPGKNWTSPKWWVMKEAVPGWGHWWHLATTEEEMDGTKSKAPTLHPRKHPALWMQFAIGTWVSWLVGWPVSLSLLWLPSCEYEHV